MNGIPSPLGERVRVRGKAGDHSVSVLSTPTFILPRRRGRKVFKEFRMPRSLLRGGSLL